MRALVVPWAHVDDTATIPAPKLTEAAADPAPVIDVIDGRLPGPPVAMRIGWNQTRRFVEADFIRANNHPIDGVAVGLSDSLAAPPFPPALDTDPTLYMGVWFAGDPDVADIRGSLDVEPVSYLSLFGDKAALTVDGTAGHYYATTDRLTPNGGELFGVVIPGPRILTEDDLATINEAIGALAARVEALENV